MTNLSFGLERNPYLTPVHPCILWVSVLSWWLMSQIRSLCPHWPRRQGCLHHRLNLLQSPLLFWPLWNLADSMSAGPWVRPVFIDVECVVFSSQWCQQAIPLSHIKLTRKYDPHLVYGLHLRALLSFWGKTSCDLMPPAEQSASKYSLECTSS